MLDRKKQTPSTLNQLYSLKLYSISLLLTLCISCVTTVKEGEYPLNSRIMAENSSIKKRLPLIERENDVLRKENHQHRTNILALETKIKNLGLELAFLGEKYDNDIARNEMQIRDLELTIQEIEKESSKKIKSLISSKAALEKKLTRQVQALNKKAITQKKAFDLEKAQLMKANAKRESNLSSRIEALKKSMTAKDTENDSLKKAHDETSTKLSEANALTVKLKKSRDDALAELETVNATNARLTRALNSQ